MDPCISDRDDNGLHICLPSGSKVPGNGLGGDGHKSFGMFRRSPRESI